MKAGVRQMTSEEKGRMDVFVDMRQGNLASTGQEMLLDSRQENRRYCLFGYQMPEGPTWMSLGNVDWMWLGTRASASKTVDRLRTMLLHTCTRIVCAPLSQGLICIC